MSLMSQPTPFDALCAVPTRFPFRSRHAYASVFPVSIPTIRCRTNHFVWFSTYGMASLRVCGIVEYLQFIRNVGVVVML